MDKGHTNSPKTIVNSVWQQLTLYHWPASGWQQGSYLSRLWVGSLRAWRSSSWLLAWAEPLGAVLCCLILSLAPFVSTSLIGVLLFAAGAYWVLLTLSDERGESGFTPIHLLLLLYWAIATVATAFSPVKAAALTGWLKLTLYLLLFALMARVLRSHRLRSILITVFLLITQIVSVYGIRQWFFGAEALATWTDPTSPSAGMTRVYSYLGNPNLLAAYLITAVAFSIAAVFAWRGWLPKLLGVTMVVTNAACLFMTGSRGGWIGFVVAGYALLVLMVYWWTPRLPSKWQRWALPGVLGGSAAFLLLAVLLIEPVRLRVATMFVGREDSSNNFRINVWEAVLEMIQDRPILGIGPGNSAFNKIYPLYMRPKYTALSAYSVLLEITVETGLIGLTVFLWLLFVAINQGWRQLVALRDIANPQGYWLMAAVASLLGVMGHGFFDTVWYRPEVNTLWWLAMAVIASFYSVLQRSSSSPAPSAAFNP